MWRLTLSGCRTWACDCSLRLQGDRRACRELLSCLESGRADLRRPSGALLSLDRRAPEKGADEPTPLRRLASDSAEETSGGRSDLKLDRGGQGSVAGFASSAHRCSSLLSHLARGSLRARPHSRAGQLAARKLAPALLLRICRVLAWSQLSSPPLSFPSALLSSPPGPPRPAAPTSPLVSSFAVKMPAVTKGVLLSTGFASIGALMFVSRRSRFRLAGPPPRAPGSPPSPPRAQGIDNGWWGTLLGVPAFNAAFGSQTSTAADGTVTVSLSASEQSAGA